jgi:ABC-type nitrate/sulfonate/bicarbonate transport system substrate-binding protein
MRLAIPDLISNSYFPALAAAELGFFAAEGLDVAAELIYPVDRAYRALRDGEVDFVGGAAHAVPSAFPEWHGAKLLGALAQGMYWFLVMRADLGVARGDLAALKHRRIGAAPWVETGLRGLLNAAGMDPARDDIRIGPVPRTGDAGTNFGLAAAEALERGEIDGFWANGMATAIAVGRKVGTVVLDVRRGDGPPGCFSYTMPALVTTDRLIAEVPDRAAAAVRALAACQRALRENPQRAAEVGGRRFPPREAGLIASIVERDLPFYDAAISGPVLAGIVDFDRRMGVLTRSVPYEEAVAVQFRDLWQSGA